MKIPKHHVAVRIGLWLALTVLAFYLPALWLDFVNFDDPDYVTRNPQVQAGLSWAGSVWAFTQGHAANWHPLTWLSHMLDCQFFGLNPAGHHLTNILLHAANSGLLFLLLWRMTGALWRSACVAALFGLHPLHVESVAWVSERKDVLSAFFGLLCLWAYAAWVTQGWKSQVSDPESPQPAAVPMTSNGESRQRLSGPFALAVLFLALGLMSKPMLVTWPFVMLLLDFWPLQRTNELAQGARGLTFRRLIAEKIPFFALIAISCVVTILVQRAGGAVAGLNQLPLAQRLMNAPIAYCEYLFKTFWPANLAIVYPLVPRHSWVPTFLALAVLGGITLLVFQERRRSPFLVAGWAWFLGTLVPVIGLVQVGNQACADRYTYLPSIGLFLALVWGVSDWAEGRVSRRIVALAGAGSVAACALLTLAQISFWKNSETLFRHAVEVTANNFVAWDRLGMAFSDQRQPVEAQRCFQKSLDLNPAYQYAWNNLGCLLNDQGRYAEAVTNFQHALQLDPNLAAAHNSLGTARLNLQQTEPAIQEFTAALRLRPNYSEAHYNLANGLAAKGDFKNAENHYRAALALNPALTDAHNNLAFILVRQGQLEPAVAEFRSALALQPALWEARHGLGETLSAQGRAGEAAPEFLELARVHGTAGRFRQAAAAAAKALEQARKAGLETLARTAEEQARRYRSFADSPNHPPAPAPEAK